MRNSTLMSYSGMLLVLVGCSSSVPTSPAPTEDLGATAPDPSNAAPAPVYQSEAALKRTFKPVQLGTASAELSQKPDASAHQVDSVMDALKPLQILLGSWNGTARRAFVESPEWVWDLQTNPEQPALVMTSDKGVYLKEGRLTFDVDVQKFRLEGLDADGKKRTYQGTFSEPVRDEPSDEKKLQRTYKLELTEVEPMPTEQWRLVLSQQGNDRYLLEVDRKRGEGNFLRYDTINTQREGTSFALSDTDYGDKTCIISQGLGVMTVSYQGKSYYVCCTGCKAAFEDDPAKWIAKWEAKQKEMAK